MNISFDYNEMKNFILKTGKYKIVNVKCFNLIPGSWINRFTYQEEEIEIEVAYLTDDIESEKWIFDKAYMKRKEDYYMFTIESVFYREFKSKLLNL
jgi:hypothetical protein